MRRQVTFFTSLLFISASFGQINYSIDEEMRVGSLVGNIAEDLGIGVERLKSRSARVYFGDSKQYIELNKDRGVLLIKERIDREALCAQSVPYINDNEPSFESISKRFEISELAIIGSKFVLEKAIDADIGTNGLQSYSLSPTNNFQLKLESQANGDKKVEMILQKALDREQQEKLSLLLTAFDGGQPLLCLWQNLIWVSGS
uniref:Cadherin domain-containing protein n=1 Tax=Hippocampus comes TaxID=109280 RepID=A0A3Q2XV98_HIPCM